MLTPSSDSDQLTQLDRIEAGMIEARKSRTWQANLFLVLLLLVGGGCAIYGDIHRSASEARQEARQDAFEREMRSNVEAMTLNLRQVMEMWKDDPKNFDRTGKQIEEIRDWIRTHR